MEWMRLYQLDIMLFLSGVCGVLAFLAGITKVLPRRRRHVLVSIELGAMCLLIFDRFAYIYRGDISTTGFWMVRISNFLVYFLSLWVIHSFNLYLIDLYRNEGKLKKIPLRLILSEVLFTVGEAMVVISQFTGIYYTFDEENQYQRAPWFAVCYCFPLLIIMLQLTVVVKHYNRLSKRIRMSLLLFTILPLIASIVQIFAYGVSLTNITMVGLAVVIYIFALLELNETAEHANQMEIKFLKTEQKNIHRLFEQTAEALASAIDAKDPYTRGHSTRVADYSERIARLAGKTDKECEEIYFAALLHDVGKIGIPNAIINKDSALSDEEYEMIRQHPVIGNRILSSISQMPFLSVGAHYHHERYDGKGYPDRLKGEDIPEIARIIAVADTYDAMTSKRSYRDPIPQQKVREEMVKGLGQQFDPKFGQIMLQLIDQDINYEMQEIEEVEELAGRNELICGERDTGFSEGIHIAKSITKIRLHSKTEEGFVAKDNIPSLILFDSLDARIHISDGKEKEMLYTEYGRLCFDGTSDCKAARKMKVNVQKHADVPTSWEEIYKFGLDYELEAVRNKDHLLVRITNRYQTTELIVALPDSSRFAYAALTGTHCLISKVELERSEENVGEDYIPRIAEEISYINVPAGDIPNVQIDGWCTASTQGVPVVDGMKIMFHTMSLPTARLIWHCPYVSIYSADDKQVNGVNYHEFVLVRLDGENWESDDHAENKIFVNMNDDFESWDAWKAQNKKGMDCVVTIRKKGNKVAVLTQNGGISIKSVTTISDEAQDVYVALTGDQCALTNIRIKT